MHGLDQEDSPKILLARRNATLLSRLESVAASFLLFGYLMGLGFLPGKCIIGRRGAQNSH
jgi:hypothetical protein